MSMSRGSRSILDFITTPPPPPPVAIHNVEGDSPSGGFLSSIVIILSVLAATAIITLILRYLLRPRYSATKCSICLRKFKENDELRVLPACGHAFHDICVSGWLEKKITCPLCRSVVVQVEEVQDPTHSTDLSPSPGGSSRVENAEVESIDVSVESSVEEDESVGSNETSLRSVQNAYRY